MKKILSILLFLTAAGISGTCAQDTNGKYGELAAGKHTRLQINHFKLKMLGFLSYVTVDIDLDNSTIILRYEQEDFNTGVTDSATAQYSMKKDLIIKEKSNGITTGIYFPIADPAENLYDYCLIRRESVVFGQADDFEGIGDLEFYGEYLDKSIFDALDKAVHAQNE